MGANDRIRIGVAGINGRGGSHINAFGGQENVEVSCLIDPDSSLFEGRQKMIKEKFGNTPKCYQDIREALEDKELDAVSIATCNHWHSLITVWACQAGKDVYVEKPCSHNVFEGRQCVEAAKKYDRVVQHGTQSRTSNGWAKTVAAIASGKYGKLKVARGFCCKPRWSIGFKEVETPPEHLDFNLWLGPAPEQPFHRNLVHYNWHWFWDTGNGDVGNQGVHQMDIARWGVSAALPGVTLPKSVVSMGARYVNEPDHGYKDQGETPNQQLCVHDFGDDVLLVFETRGLVGKHDEWPRIVDNYFYTDEGILYGGGKFKPHGSDETVSVDVEYDSRSGNPFSNFTDVMRSRKLEDLDACITEGHPSSALCHLGNISYRLGEVAAEDQIVERMGENDVVQESLAAVTENVKGVFPELDPAFTLGPKLKFDPEKEQFVGNAEADKLLTRDYREPFAVPEIS
jgi:predicted dehydrogenase